jgi:hypothetical protein
LIREANDAYARIKDNFVVFDGYITGWDVSPVAPEFRHGSHEAMLVVDGEASRDFYFFINNRLWKFYRELKQETFAGQPFDAVADALQRKFGPAERSFASRGEDAPAGPVLSWSQQGTQLVATKRGAHYCLIFEDEKTLQHLAVLRKNALPRHKERSGAIDAVLMTDAERSRFHDAVDRSLER